jgi:hypothetical protein
LNIGPASKDEPDDFVAPRVWSRPQKNIIARIEIEAVSTVIHGHLEVAA